MSKDASMHRADELAQERDALRRGLRRSRLAAVAVLVIAAALGAAAVVAALRAQTNAVEARERLWESLVSQARAERLSGEVGGRTKALQAIRDAAAIRPTEELRDEAIAALALIDLQPVERWSGFPEDAMGFAFSAELRYSAVDHGRAIEILDNSTHARHAWLLKHPDRPDSDLVYPPEQLLFSPGESLLAGVYWGGDVVIWDVEKKSERWRTRISQGDARLCSLSFDAAGKTLALLIPSAGVVRRYSAVDGEVLGESKEDAQLQAVALSGDGSQLAWSTPAGVTIEDLRSGERREYKAPSTVFWLCWSPDDTRLALGCYQGEVQIIDTMTGIRLDCPSRSSTIDGLNFSSDGRYLIGTAWDGATRFWDAHQGSLRLITETGMGKTVCKGSARIGFAQTFADVGFWELVDSKIYRGFGVPAGQKGLIGNLEIDPGSRWIVAHGAARHVWEIASGRLVVSGDQRISDSIFSRDGRWLYGMTRHGFERALVMRDDAEQFSLGEPQEVADVGAENLAMMMRGAEGRSWVTVVSSGARGLRLDVAAESQEIETVLPNLKMEHGITRFALSADRRWAVGSYWKGRSTELWDVEKKQRVRELDVFGGDAAFLPGGRLLVGGSQRGVTFWEVGSWRKLVQFPRVTASSVPAHIEFSEDGRYVSYENTKRTLTLIDTTTLEVAAVFSNPGREVIRGRCHSDDGNLLAVSTENRLHLWDLQALQRELAGLGLRFGKQLPPPANLAAAADKISPTSAAIFAAAVLLTALGFGLYSMLYQRRLIQKFDAQFEALELTQKELLQSEKMKALGTLSAGVAHDFKNLLSVIKLSADLIRRDSDGRADLIEETDAIGNAVAQGDQVVRAMLGYSRGVDSDSDLIDVPDVIEGTVALLGQQFLSGVRLQLDIERGLPLVRVSAGALQQILLNLVINASEAMGGKGELTISAALSAGAGSSDLLLRPRRAESYIIVQIADDGPGMNVATRARIFEPFFTTKTVGAEKGTGLGLATVYKIVKDDLLGLAVESCEGEGARFELILPVDGRDSPSHRITSPDIVEK